MTDIVEDLQLGLHVETEKVIAVIQALRQRVNELEAITTHFKKVSSNTQRRLELKGDELAALKQSQGKPMAMEAIYAAWHGAGVDIAGGDWNRFAKMLPPLYTSAPTSPEGWQIVPIEPTKEMIDAARDQHEGEKYLPVSLYKSMLAAAPKPEDVK